MIISQNMNPRYSLYYIGGIIIKLLQEKENIDINMIVEYMLNEFEYEISVEYIYYSLDYLFLLSVIIVEEGVLQLCK